ncbi:hypothetical protein NDU88_001851 [Pleurodeles waltl]|uniref:Uncharacterized protein n=1 Tax=Pleurodeles waltl TaxID=8319 RepID=A0AAV7P518_PLEWA|nr:hypothetical protein NDU88_001851 [Pleurodeles waltl]
MKGGSTEFNLVTRYFWERDCDGPAQRDPFTIPTCAGAVRNAPGSPVETANQERLPAAKEGPGRCCAGGNELQMPAAGSRTACNRGVKSSSAGRGGGKNQRKARGVEEADQRPQRPRRRKESLPAALQEKRGNHGCVLATNLRNKGGWVVNREGEARESGKMGREIREGQRRQIF